MKTVSDCDATTMFHESGPPARSQQASAAIAHDQSRSYKDILKSSVLIGGASAVGVLCGMVRTKVFAILLGPSGVGLLGVYTLIGDLARNAASLGINNSGVRQIAEAVRSDDSERIARTVSVLRRISAVLAVFGCVAVFAFAGNIAEWTFGDGQHVVPVATLGLAVFFGLIASAQGALIQGMRRVKELALMGLLGAVLSAAVSIVVVYYFREAGLAPAIVCSAAITALISWIFSRRLAVPARSVSGREVIAEGRCLLRLGAAFLASSLLMTASAYVVRVLVTRQLGLEAAGLHAAAWTVAGMYVGMILQAMGTDFYPRLVGVIADHPACNRLINEQTLVSVLLAGAGLAGTITVAGPLLLVFYSPAFEAAGSALRWTALGMALRVFLWPVGYILIAKGRAVLFLGADATWTIVYLAFSWLLVPAFGVDGAGMAFAAAYMVHAAIVIPIATRLTGFAYSRQNLLLAGAYCVGVIFAFSAQYYFPSPLGMTAGLAITASLALMSFWLLKRLASPNALPRKFAQVIR